MSNAHIIGNGALVCHAFNKDASKMAVCINTNDIYILACPKGPSGKFQLLDVLKEHTALVMNLDWCAKSDSIVSCSADRNAYVWIKQSDDKWKPTLAMLQTNRAATCVRWSPQGNKFAVGTGSKLLAIGYFESEYDWWLTKHIKKSIKSTVTCVDWHPNNVLIACGATDFKVRIFNAFLDKTESKAAESTWRGKENFGSLIYEASTQNGGWVHDVAFSEDGTKLAWVCHNSTVCVVDSASGGDSPVMRVFKHEYLPFTTCIWLSARTIVAAGHDCTPISFTYDGSELKFNVILDQMAESKGVGKLTAMRKFQDIDRMATSENVSSKLQTIHQNSISEIRIVKSASNNSVQTFSSIGLDGVLVFWDVATLAQQISKLRLQ